MYLCLLSLCESFTSRLAAAVPYKGHDPNEGRVPSQQFRYFLHTFPVLREYHDSSVHLWPSRGRGGGGSCQIDGRLVLACPEMIENNLFQLVQLWVAIEKRLSSVTRQGCTGDGKLWTGHFVAIMSQCTTVEAVFPVTKSVTKKTQNLDKFWCSEYLRLCSGLMATFFEGGGEKLMEGSHTVKLKKLIGMVQADTQSKI